MPLSYHYNAATRIVETKATGVVSTRDLIECLTSVLADESIEPGFVEVVDLEGIDDLVMRYQELQPFKKIWSEYQKKGCKSTIVYAPTELSFGTIRMVQTIVQLSDDDVADHFILVRSREELQEQLGKLNT